MSIEAQFTKENVNRLKSSPQYQKVRWAAIVFGVLFIFATCAAGYLAWRHFFHPPKPVTHESQQQLKLLKV